MSFGEKVTPGFESTFAGPLIYEEQTPFQRLEVFQNEHFGRMLVLDGFVQTTERDEFCYHEMLVHPSLSSLVGPLDVCIIGGGDGGTLRRVLEHPAARVVQCEIDEAVTRMSRILLPSVSCGAFDDPRAELVFVDGAEYLSSRHDLDAIIVDSTDPIGAAAILISAGFYRTCKSALRPGGVVVAQTGSPLYQLDELLLATRNMRAWFETVETYLGFVPSYPGVVWSFTAATDGRPVSARTAGRKGKFYSDEVHRSAFALPGFIRDKLNVVSGV